MLLTCDQTILRRMAMHETYNDEFWRNTTRYMFFLNASLTVYMTFSIDLLEIHVLDNF